MRVRVTVADYGIGNLLSVRRALEHCGAEVEMAGSAAAIEGAERLVVPGVGAFADCMVAVRTHGFEEPVKRYAASGRPLLGICVGMQILFEVGEEHGEHRGLGLFPGRVVAIPSAAERKIPHIGWAVLDAAGRGWEGTILGDAVPQSTAVYFVHSFHAQPARGEDRLAICDYNGFAVTAAVSHANLSGCQFHPEKSGKAGLAIIDRFLRMAA